MRFSFRPALLAGLLLSFGTSAGLTAARAELAPSIAMPRTTRVAVIDSGIAQTPLLKPMLVEEVDMAAPFNPRPADPAQTDYQFVWRQGRAIRTQNARGEWTFATGTSIAAPFMTAELASQPEDEG